MRFKQFYQPILSGIPFRLQDGQHFREGQSIDRSSLTSPFQLCVIV